MHVQVLVEREVYHQMDVDGVAAGVHFTKTIQHVLGASAAQQKQRSDSGSSSSGGRGSEATGSATATASTKQGPVPASSSTSSMTTEADDEARKLVRVFAASQRANACAALSAATKAATAGAGAAPSGAWAFKKPDLMNLLPYLAEVFPRMQVRNEKRGVGAVSSLALLLF